MRQIMINLDYQSRTPIYEQIVNGSEKYVALGILKEKTQIPSIREMASNLGINPNTVKGLLLLLAPKELLYQKILRRLLMRRLIKKLVLLEKKLMNLLRWVLVMKKL